MVKYACYISIKYIYFKIQIMWISGSFKCISFARYMYIYVIYVTPEACSANANARDCSHALGSELQRTLLFRSERTPTIASVRSPEQVSVSIHDTLPVVFGLNYIFLKETLLFTKEGLIDMNGIQRSITKYIKCRPQRPNKRLKFCICIGTLI
jgi:hypothetical protein